MNQLVRKQVFSQDIETIWNFFSSPINLSKITPEHMSFDIKSTLPDQMYAGMIIEYRVRPLANIPIPWVTEITHMQKLKYFIDEQRFGPYSFWHHQHHFKQVSGGTEVTDQVNYRLPLGIVGSILCGRFIKRKLNAIFEYREEALKKLLP